MKANEVQTMLGVAYEDLEILRNKGVLKAVRKGNGHYDYTAESVRYCLGNARGVRELLHKAKLAGTKVLSAPSRPTVGSCHGPKGTAGSCHGPRVSTSCPTTRGCH